MLRVVVKKVEGVSKKGKEYKGSCFVKVSAREEDYRGNPMRSREKQKEAKTSTVPCSLGIGNDGSNGWVWPESDRSRKAYFSVHKRITCTLQCMTPKGTFKRSTMLGSTKFTVYLGNDDKPVSVKKYLRDSKHKKNGRISFSWQLAGGLKPMKTVKMTVEKLIRGKGQVRALRIAPVGCNFLDARKKPLDAYQEHRLRAQRLRQLKELRVVAMAQKAKERRRLARKARMRAREMKEGEAKPAEVVVEEVKEEEVDDDELLAGIKHHMLLSRAYEGLEMPHQRRHEVLDLYDALNAERVRQDNAQMREMLMKAKQCDKDAMNVLLSPEKALPPNLPVGRETDLWFVAHNTARSQYSFRLRANKSIRYEARVTLECAELKGCTHIRVAVRVTPRCSGPFELQLILTEWPGGKKPVKNTPISCAWPCYSLMAQQSAHLAREDVKLEKEPLCKGALGVYYVAQMHGSAALCDVVASTQSREVLRFHECLTMLEGVRGPHIAFYFGSIQTQPLTLVQEAPAYGTLSYIIDQKRPLLPSLCAKILCDCARAIEYVHALRRVHGSFDTNCFGVVSLDEQSVCGKLFAFTTPVPNKVPGLSPLLPPISAYTSPEILAHLEDFATLNPSPAWDVYSMGTLIFALASLVDPIDTAPSTMDEVNRLPTCTTTRSLGVC